MSDVLSQDDIVHITGFVRPHAQVRILRDLGYIVLGTNGKGQVRALSNHPSDPANQMKKLSTREKPVKLNFKCPPTATNPTRSSQRAGD